MSHGRRLVKQFHRAADSDTVGGLPLHRVEWRPVGVDKPLDSDDERQQERHGDLRHQHLYNDCHSHQRFGDEESEPGHVRQQLDGSADGSPVDGLSLYGMERRPQVFKPEEVVTGAGLPVARLGLDAPGRAFAVWGGLRAADGGGELIQPSELAQLGSEHAVILRKTARIVSLHIDDMAVLNAHVAMIPGLAGGLYQAA